MALSEGGMQYLIASARANVGLKAGRYMYEAPPPATPGVSGGGAAGVPAHGKAGETESRSPDGEGAERRSDLASASSRQAVRERPRIAAVSFTR